jgi:phosphopantetheinyl transferase (holo-ACP synthase)
VVNLSGEVARIAGQMNIEQVSLSITHTANFAIASVAALREV